MRTGREIRDLCRPEDPGFAALDRERRIVSTALRGAAKVVETVWNEDRADSLESGTGCPECGSGVLRSQGRRERCLMSLLGWIRLRRAYYVCDNGACSHTVHPRDLSLNLESDQYTSGFRALVGDLAAQLSFGKVARLLETHWTARAGTARRRPGRPRS